MKFKLTLSLKNYLKISMLQGKLPCGRINVTTYNPCSGLRVLLKNKNCENDFLQDHDNAI